MEPESHGALEVAAADGEQSDFQHLSRESQSATRRTRARVAKVAHDRHSVTEVTRKNMHLFPPIFPFAPAITQRGDYAVHYKPHSGGNFRSVASVENWDDTNGLCQNEMRAGPRWECFVRKRHLLSTSSVGEGFMAESKICLSDSSRFGTTSAHAEGIENLHRSAAQSRN